jgi:outer membrane protein assembly factor BamE (lipoprotein component of BamABCDE complex)
MESPQMSAPRRRSLLRTTACTSLLLGALVVLSACETKIAVRGNLPEAEQVLEVQPGVSTRDDVVRSLGSPSTLSTFQDDTWYYIGHRSEQFAFFKPEVTDRSVLVVTFTESGRVEDTKLYTVENGTIIDPVSRKTPTEGRELTVLQQIIGNIGRFPTEGK